MSKNGGKPLRNTNEEMNQSVLVSESGGEFDFGQATDRNTIGGGDVSTSRDFFNNGMPT